MSETALRTQARLGSLKLLAGGVLLGVLIFGVIETGQFITAMRNPGDPQLVTLEQLVNGSIGSERYATVSGYAMYDVGYAKTMDGQKYDVFYALMDDHAGYLILVEAPTAHATESPNAYVSITGMTRNTPTELKSKIQSDIPDLKEQGVVTTAEIYLAAGQKPPSTSGTLTTLLFVNVIAGICVIPFFFPSVVFAPTPTDLSAVQSQVNYETCEVKATGRFVQLTQLEPTIRTGGRIHKFNRAIANIVPLEDTTLLIYIHHIVRTKLYFVATISKDESHWGAFITKNTVTAIEAGKLYGWEDRWAVRFRYQGQNDKPQTLFVIFGHANFQSEFVQLLHKMDFVVDNAVLNPRSA